MLSAGGRVTARVFLAPPTVHPTVVFTIRKDVLSCLDAEPVAKHVLIGGMTAVVGLPMRSKEAHRW